MEAKQVLKQDFITPPLVPAETGDTIQVGALDSVALVKLCVTHPEHVPAWQQFLARFLGRIRAFVYHAQQLQRLPSANASAQFGPSDQPDVEDLAQEVLLRLIANQCLLLRRFAGDSEEALIVYLSVISSSVVFNRYRFLRRQRIFTVAGTFDDEGVLQRIGVRRDDLKMERGILMREILRILEEILQTEISEPAARNRYLLIFKLHVFEGLSLSEISQYGGVNLSKKGVDKAIASIIRRLKDKLTVSGGEHE